MGSLWRLRLKVTLPIVAALTALLTLMGTFPAYALNGSYDGLIGIQGSGNSDLWVYSPVAGQIVNTGHGIQAGSSPALMCVGIPCEEVAVFPNTQGLLCFDGLFQGSAGGQYACTSLGVEPGSSPSAIRLDNANGLEVAFEGSKTDLLWVYNSATGVGTNTHLGMAPGTSPSMIGYYDSSYHDDGFQVAFQDTQGYLCVYLTANNSHRCTGLGVSAGTSPSLTDATDHGVVAFNANSTNDLYLYNYDNNTNQNLDTVMYPYTSPAAYGDERGDIQIAYQGGNEDLWVYNTYYSVAADEGLPMNCCTSPSITVDGSTPAGDADPPEIAFESYTGLLTMFDWWDLEVDYTGYGMGAGTSPSWDGSAGASVGFELNYAGS